MITRTTRRPTDITCAALHRIAMADCDTAKACKDRVGRQVKFTVACFKEWSAAVKALDLDAWPSNAIPARSAACMAFDAGMYDRARRMIQIAGLANLDPSGDDTSDKPKDRNLYDEIFELRMMIAQRRDGRLIRWWRTP